MRPASWTWPRTPTSHCSSRAVSSGAGRTAVLIAKDRTVLNRLTRLDAEFGLMWAAAQDAAEADLVVIDLAEPGAVDEVREARQRWPTAVIAGYLAAPDPDLWTAGQRAGCDLVANRGALVVRLRPLLGANVTGTRTFPLLDESELAGRLGRVACISETPVGPIGVYQIDGEVFAVADRCPHAGAMLSDGELDHRTLTCSRHGSQFDVCTGERLRGPADSDIARFAVVVERGQVSLLLGNRKEVREGE